MVTCLPGTRTYWFYSTVKTSREQAISNIDIKHCSHCSMLIVSCSQYLIWSIFQHCTQDFPSPVIIRAAGLDFVVVASVTTTTLASATLLLNVLLLQCVFLHLTYYILWRVSTPTVDDILHRPCHSTIHAAHRLCHSTGGVDATHNHTTTKMHCSPDDLCGFAAVSEAGLCRLKEIYLPI